MLTLISTGDAWTVSPEMPAAWLNVRDKAQTNLLAQMTALSCDPLSVRH